MAQVINCDTLVSAHVDPHFQSAEPEGGGSIQAIDEDKAHVPGNVIRSHSNSSLTSDLHQGEGEGGTDGGIFVGRRDRKL